MIAIYDRPTKENWAELTRRRLPDDNSVEAAVSAIVARVRDGGDAALREIAMEIEGFCPENFKVSQQEMDAAEKNLSDDLKRAIERAAANIEAFHAAQKADVIEVETMPGVRCRRKSLPISRVGLYIPGGSAPLFSTLLMLAIPAKIAGCREIVLCTPCNREGKVADAVLYAARFCGVDTIFKLGGAQAIAAMAYGTDTVPRVSKIFGPGNRYVTKAKQLVSASGVAIDMPAGPSEVMVMADGSANPVYIAADLLSQAEHGPDSQAILLCDSMETATAVNEETVRMLERLPRALIAEKALENSRIIVLSDIDEMIEFANLYASEHLIISMRNPWSVADRIEAAGSIFIGNYSPESAGDYASGTNHTLPTMGLATAFSGIGTDSFRHQITYQELTKEGLERLGDTIITMADAEGLEAHANAVKVRLEK
ncbi:MAG: histidinol dehydrogenase [Bacteroidales bacterium]|nr:histidinol dehydrogenase [Bacteroidales bacterium]